MVADSDTTRLDSEGDSVSASPQAPSSSLPATTDRKRALDLRTLSAMHRRVLFDEIARRVLERHSPERIAFDLAISRNTLSRILRDPEFKPAFEAIYERVYAPIDAAIRDEKMQVTERLQFGSQRALTTLFELLELSKSDEVRRKTADSILEKAGFGSVQRRVTAGVETVRLERDTAELLAALLDRHVPATIEAEVVPDPPSSETPSDP